MTIPRSAGELRAVDIDNDKIDEAVLALLYLTLHDRFRAWKGHDWDALDRLYRKGMICDPVGKAKSVVFTARVQPLMVEVTEEGSQRPAHRLPCSRTPILGVPLDVADHLLLTDLAQVVITGGAHLVQEPADDREMTNDG